MNPKVIIRCVVVLLFGGLAYGLCRSTPEANSPSEAGVIMNLPDHVGSLSGTDQEVSEAERVILPGDTQFAKKMYKNFSGDQINCQIVLAGGEKRSIHRPEICLPAQGWNKKSSETVPIVLSDGRILNVTKLVISRMVEVQPGVQKELTSLFLYWFIGKTTTTPHHWYRILHTDLDRVMYNVNHRWAYVIVSAPILDGFVPGGKNSQETLDSLKSFIAELAPQILKPSVQMEMAHK